jgi:cytochrome b involved in lipid metabolism
MNKHLAVAASAATILLFLGAGCSELPPTPNTDEQKPPQNTEEVSETEQKVEPAPVPVVQQAAPTPAPKETTRVQQREREDNENENEDEDENEGRGTAPVAPAPVQPQVKPASPTPTPAPAPTVKTYTMAEVQKANNGNNCWSVVSGKVYNLTPFTPGHPGGEPAILSMCGKDGTAGFKAQHGGEAKPETVLAKYYLGVLK